MLFKCFALVVLLVAQVRCYDPEDPAAPPVPDDDPQSTDADPESPEARQTPRFEAFYPRSAYGVVGGQSRPAHGHATFYQHRHPALIDANNSPAYGFRFDGKRRFNFDRRR